MFLMNLLKLFFFMIVIYFFYSIFRMLLFGARTSRYGQERMRMKDPESTRTRRARGNSSKRDEVIELDKNQYKVE